MNLHSLIVTCLLGIAINSFAIAQQPLKVYILVGQSNMQGHAQVRTFEHIGMDPKTEPILREMQNENGAPRICDDVWISYLSSGGEKQGRLTAGFGADDNKIGPELAFGIYTQKMVDQPILIIKTAWGGKSLHTDFRPPSAGPYEFNATQLAQLESQNKNIDQIKADRAEATGHYYRLTMEHVRKVLADIKQVYPDYDAKQGYELAGFVWFQGWNDMVDRGVYPNRDQPGGYNQYSDVLGHFIRDVRKELEAPNLPFVIGVLGVNGPIAEYAPEQQRYSTVHQNFRDAMAAPASLSEFKGNVAAFLTENCWEQELVELRSREAKIKQKVKQLQTEGKLVGDEAKTTLEKYRTEEFTDREIETLQKGVSNAEYHYLGSAKIMAQIGKGFAEALEEIKKNSQE